MLRLLAAVLLTCALLGAQEFRSTLAGRITDPSGAAIPNIHVLVINNETGARSQTTSTETGEYTLPFLAPGNYRLIVEAAGFRKYNQEHIQIGTNTRVTQDVGASRSEARPKP